MDLSARTEATAASLEQTSAAMGNMAHSVNVSADSMGRVDESTQVIQTAGKTMEELVANADHIHKLLQDISRTAVEQSTGITEIGAALQTLDQSTQQNAALVEQTAAASSSVKDLAQQLADRVRMFKVVAD